MSYESNGNSSIGVLVLAIGGVTASVLQMLSRSQEALAALAGACLFVIVMQLLDWARSVPVGATGRAELDPAPPSSGLRMAPTVRTQATTTPRSPVSPPCGPHRLSGCIACARRVLSARQLAPQAVPDDDPTIAIRSHGVEVTEGKGGR